MLGIRRDIVHPHRGAQWCAVLTDLTGPVITMAASRWHLKGNAATVRSLADVWNRLAEATRRAHDDLAPASTALSDRWQGSASDAYDAHRLALEPDMVALARTADEVVVALESTAQTIVSAQVRLAGLLAVAGGLGSVEPSADRITFRLYNQNGVDELNRLAGDADSTREVAEQALRGAAGTLNNARAGLARIGSDWSPQPKSLEDLRPGGIVMTKPGGRKGGRRRPHPDEEWGWVMPPRPPLPPPRPGPRIRPLPPEDPPEGVADPPGGEPADGGDTDDKKNVEPIPGGPQGDPVPGGPWGDPDFGEAWPRPGLGSTWPEPGLGGAWPEPGLGGNWPQPGLGGSWGNPGLGPRIR